MTRTIMISDIHGCVEPLNRLLDQIRYDSANDQLILLGDYVDRGPHSKETVDRVMDLVLNHRAIALRGNHDQRMVDLIRTEDPDIQHRFLEHGGRQTLASYCDSDDLNFDAERFEQAKAHINAKFAHHIAFLDKLPYYYEGDFLICVHAGLNPRFADWRKQPKRDFMYIKNDFIRNKTRANKKVVFGHTRAMELHDSAEVWFQEDKIGIDGGCAYGQQLNALVFEDENFTFTTYKALANGRD
ncbi:serine/threonine protein phosphatase [Cohnella endophytica]|uniref:Serine/threonine protein phosphatase n=1 Tax=Cohnella endophytica TaxID=2419778 RepID=A0A494Y3E8_9BACL|nr:metallophosphoesterase family protein [Cohnella endophytica]RKP56821.1 serine/threonine protein phosphatase [Cohnella endophytica]